MNLDTIKNALDNNSMSDEARETLTIVRMKLEDYIVDSCEIFEAVTEQIEECYDYDIQESFDYLAKKDINDFEELINMGMTKATEFAQYLLNEEVVNILEEQETRDEELAQEEEDEELEREREEEEEEDEEPEEEEEEDEELDEEDREPEDEEVDEEVEKMLRYLYE